MAGQRIIHRIPFDAIKEAALPYTEALCRRWLPNGKRQGGWYVARCPWRDDANPSLGVSIRSGFWRDFATGDHGDTIKLFQRLYGGTAGDAARAVARAVNFDIERAA